MPFADFPVQLTPVSMTPVLSQTAPDSARWTELSMSSEALIRGPYSVWTANRRNGTSVLRAHPKSLFTSESCSR